MTRGSVRLEHLFSRYIDGECTPEECDLLESLTREDPAVRRMFENYRRLDQEIGGALRLAMGRPRRVIPRRSLWVRAGEVLAVAAAACLAVLLWHSPSQPTAGPSGAGKRLQQAASWFAPTAPQGDAVEPLPSAYERPELRLRGTERNWIVIPGDRPGTYFVIEVDHVRTHVIGVHQDF
jgi:hypothetical protein